VISLHSSGLKLTEIWSTALWEIQIL